MYLNNINTYSMLLLHQRLPYSTPQNRYYVAAFAPTVTTIHRIQQHHVDVVSSSIQRQQQRHRMMSTTPNQDGTTTATAPTSSSKEDQLYYDPAIFDDSVTDFQSLGIQSSVLLRRLHQQQLYRPTKVQIAAYPAISGTGISSSTTTSDNDNSDSYGDDSERPPPPPTTHTDVTIACETGSGKTLAYLLPIIDDILQRKSSAAQMSRTDDTSPGKDSSSTATTKFLDVGYDYARAIILVPNKELVQQVVRMAVPLSGGARHAVVYGGHTLPDPRVFDNDHDDGKAPLPQDIVRIAIMPGGLDEPLDFLPFRKTVAVGGGTQPPIDLLISTPASVGPLGLSPKNIAFFADIQTIVIDEADMLLDGGYIQALGNVLMGFKRADRLDAVKWGEIPKTQHVFVAATLPNYGLRSVDAYLNRKFPKAKRIELDSLHMARHSGLIQPTVWMEMESKKDRMMKLVELFQSTTTDDTLQNEKVMVFLNSVADCEASCEALQRAGIHCVPYHAQIPLSDRTAILDRFRRYEVRDHDSVDGIPVTDDDDDDDATSPVPVLVCTDLASRGLDVPGVTVVVQLQFCGNVVGHLHRMGRCGRGGNQRRYGRGYVFYGIKERALVETVRAAEQEQERMVLPGDVVTQDWDGNPDDVTNQDSSLSEERGEATGSISTMGKVTTAFSRRRGFNKKLRKLRRSTDSNDYADNENQ